MRVIVLVILLLVGGAFFAAYQLLPERHVSPRETAALISSCLDCHAAPPQYRSISAMHEIHDSLSCTRCHGDYSLTPANGIHSTLTWVAVGLAALSLAGIAATFVTAGRRLKRGNHDAADD
jgi:hypothetical protein